jgi:transcriptional regulator with XRE-family HTH domain
MIAKGGDLVNIGTRIKQRRKELKMSADDLGKRLGKDRSTIYRYEKGDIENLPLDILEPIAKALLTTPQFLMGWEKVQKKNDVLSDIILKMNEDMELFSMVETLSKLDFAKRDAVKAVLNAFATTEK